MVLYTCRAFEVVHIIAQHFSLSLYIYMFLTRWREIQCNACQATQAAAALHSKATRNRTCVLYFL